MLTKFQLWVLCRLPEGDVRLRKYLEVKSMPGWRGQIHAMQQCLAPLNSVAQGEGEVLHAGGGGL
jgi:hypothetical protein